MKNYHPAWHLLGQPYQVQIEALKRSHGKSHYAYFMEMGLGKTALILNEYVESFSDLDTIVVITPNSFKRDWTLAPAEWGLTGITTGYWPNDPIRAGKPGRPHLNVINFEAVRSSGYDHISDLMDKHDCLLVVDESSAIKNHKSDTAKAVLDLSKRAKAVRLLNGTPITQNVLDLYPQLRCVRELERMNPYVFRNRFAVLGGFMGKKVVGVRNEVELQEIQTRCSFRAMKKDWADLPEKIYIPLRLEMTNKQAKKYKEMLQDFYTMVDGHEFTADMVISRLDKLRQITSGILIDGDKSVLLEEPKDNPKIKAALDLMEGGPGKMIIVYYYRRIGIEVYDFLKKKKLNPSYIRGQMKPEAIICEKHKFNNDSTSRVMVAQITASNKAHTLLGGEGDDRCHKMFFHDHTFSLGDRKQMEDRNHRGVQDRACLYYDPIMSPIDEAQLSALADKQDIASRVVDVVRAMRSKGI